jgi:hypothetical protein
MKCVTSRRLVPPVLPAARATWGYSATDALVAMKPDLLFGKMNDITAQLTPQAVRT